MRRMAWGLVLIVAACGSTDDGAKKKNAASSVASCKQQFSPEAGYGWEDDLRFPTAPPEDAGPPPMAPSPLEEAVAACEAAGLSPPSCDPSQVMTHHAAICVAESLGLAAGIAPHKAGITFHPDHQRIVWNVMSTEYSEPGGAEGGDWLRIDAITGAELATGSWGATP